MDASNKIRNFRDLIVWRLGKEIANEIYKLTASFPKEEMYGLVSQMRRASISIASNIAEGFNRFHNREYRQFLFVSLGSCAELETQIEISCDQGLLRPERRDALLEKIDHESRMLRNLIKTLT